MQFGRPYTPEGPGPDTRQRENQAGDGSGGGPGEACAGRTEGTATRMGRVLMAMVGLMISAVGLRHA
eukprot:10833801-Alexandrium_andersonii.AAC.1